MKRGFLATGIMLVINMWGLSLKAEPVVLKIGDDLSIPLPANHRVWIQNRKVLQVSQKGRMLVFTGSVEGRTQVQVGAKDFQIQVIQPVKRNLQDRFEKELRRMLGLRLKMVRQQVTIEGKLYRWEDWQHLAEISKDLEVSYQMAAEISPALRAKALETWQELWSQNGLAPVPVQFGQALQARIAGNSAVYDKYEDVLGPYGVRLEKDTLSLDIAPVVRVQISVAEVRRDFASKYGIQWPGSYSATVLSNGQSDFENLVFTANALEQQGKGKILASPNLLCRSGKEAEFLAGGEFPIKVMNLRFQDVVWKKYGVLLKVKPKADSSGRMSIALETEVSTIDNSRTVDGIPGLLTNRISSHFDLSKSQTIVLSGLIKNEEGQATQGLPLLSRLPVLGALFSSREFRENRTELVIFVRPSIMHEDSMAAENPPKLGHLGDLQHD
jgi:pilus assembly protein CpaC